ncbi:hypothetical protein ES702_06111 [subsurface metagenome]
MGYFRDFTSEEIDRLIKSGERIKIKFKQTGDKRENLKDENGNFLAEKVLIGREGGKKEVENELGRTLYWSR